MSEPQLPDRDQAPDDAEFELAEQVAQRIAGSQFNSPLAQPVPPPRRRRRNPAAGEQRSGAHPDNRDPQLLGSVLKQVSQRQGWQRQISLSLVLRRWPELVGQANADHSKPVTYEDGVLVIKCDSTAWATGMRYSASQLVAKLNAELGEQTIKRVDVRGPDAPSWKKGRLSVRDGRGPRDTYG